MTNVFSPESHERLCQKLYQDLGESVTSLLQDTDVNEVLLNPDGQLWADRASGGLRVVTSLSPAQSLAIIFDVAGLHGAVVTPHKPQLEAEFPYFKTLRGERFTAQIPPIVAAPSFSIRKKPEVVFTLEHYLHSGRLTVRQAEHLRALIQARKNILVCGGPGSGKTTVLNALIQAAVQADPHQRFLTLEDVPELQCRAPNQVAMVTSHHVTLRDLLRAAVRMRPDRILVGEVRGAEALDLLKAWNTGCPGGMGTVHANGVEEALQRLIDLTLEAGLSAPPLSLIQHTVDAVVFVTRKGSQKGFIQELARVGAHQHGRFTLQPLV